MEVEVERLVNHGILHVSRKKLEMTSTEGKWREEDGTWGIVRCRRSRSPGKLLVLTVEMEWMTVP